MAYQVAVVGPASCTAAEASAAFRVGRLLAERRIVVLCGGGTGVMGAVAAGARAGGGIVVGITPEGNRESRPDDLTVRIATNMGQARNAVLISSADAVIVVGGSWGTLSEVALARRRGDIAVVSLGGWHVVDSGGNPVPGITHVDSPERALMAALPSLAAQPEENHWQQPHY